MKPRSRELLDKSIAAMVAAIDVYNRPDFAYRGEAFAILALNAWELLLKAKWLREHKNRIESLYVRDATRGTKRLRYKRTRSGAPMTHGVEYLARKLAERGDLDLRAQKNLEALIELRDTATHFYHRSPALEERVLEVRDGLFEELRVCRTGLVWRGSVPLQVLSNAAFLRPSASKP